MLEFKLKDIKDMSLKEKIGQIVMCGFLSDYYDEDIKSMVEDYGLANVILFTRNYKNANQMKKLCTDIHKNIMDNCETMPLIAIDQEGGTVTRMMKEVTFAPSAMSIGASSFENGAYEAGKVLGRDMIMLGINMDLAPVLEINNDCTDAIHNVRSFGANPKIVSKHVSNYCKGLSEYGVIATAKHFPGSGDGKKDAHLDLPIIETSVDRVKNFTLVPFRDNIDVPAIMACHDLFLAIDDKVPSSLSYNCLTKLLREELGYKGLVISDSLTMNAIIGQYGLGEAAVMGIMGGLDIALVCHRKQDAVDVITAITKAYEDGRITIDMIDAKVEKVLAAKKKTIPFLNKYFNNDLVYIEDKEFSKKMQDIVDQSITLIKGNEPKITKNTLILTPVASVASQAEDVFDERDITLELQKHYKNDIVKLTKEDFNSDDILSQIDKYDDCIIITYDAQNYKKQINLFNEIINKKDTYVISLKGPIDLKHYENIKNYLCLYEYTPNSIRSLIKYLNGDIKAIGKLPL